MERIDHLLPWSSLGSERHLTVFRFGEGERKAYIQASLHADELPGMRCAWELKKRLSELEARGALNGVIELVPVANPKAFIKNEREGQPPGARPVAARQSSGTFRVWQRQKLQPRFRRVE